MFRESQRDADSVAAVFGFAAIIVIVAVGCLIGYGIWLVLR